MIMQHANVRRCNCSIVTLPCAMLVDHKLSDAELIVVVHDRLPAGPADHSSTTVATSPFAPGMAQAQVTRRPVPPLILTTAGGRGGFLIDAPHPPNRVLELTALTVLLPATYTRTGAAPDAATTQMSVTQPLVLFVGVVPLGSNRAPPPASASSAHADAVRMEMACATPPLQAGASVVVVPVKCAPWPEPGLDVSISTITRSLRGAVLSIGIIANITPR